MFYQTGDLACGCSQSRNGGGWEDVTSDGITFLGGGIVKV